VLNPSSITDLRYRRASELGQPACGMVFGSMTRGYLYDEHFYFMIGEQSAKLERESVPCLTVRKEWW
jgi:hypothetical protein